MFRLFCFLYRTDYCLLPPNDSLLPPNDNLLPPNDDLLPANDTQTHLSPASMRWGDRENSLFCFKTLQEAHHKEKQNAATLQSDCCYQNLCVRLGLLPFPKGPNALSVAPRADAVKPSAYEVRPVATPMALEPSARCALRRYLLRSASAVAKYAPTLV